MNRSSQFNVQWARLPELNCPAMAAIGEINDAALRCASHLRPGCILLVLACETDDVAEYLSTLSWNRRIHFSLDYL